MIYSIYTAMEFAITACYQADDSCSSKNESRSFFLFAENISKGFTGVF
jgi:hypothetical protein